MKNHTKFGLALVALILVITIFSYRSSHTGIEIERIQPHESQLQKNENKTEMTKADFQKAFDDVVNDQPSEPVNENLKKVPVQ